MSIVSDLMADEIHGVAKVSATSPADMDTCKDGDALQAEPVRRTMRKRPKVFLGEVEGTDSDDDDSPADKATDDTVSSGSKRQRGLTIQQQASLDLSIYSNDVKAFTARALRHPAALAEQPRPTSSGTTADALSDPQANSQPAAAVYTPQQVTRHHDFQRALEYAARLGAPPASRAMHPALAAARHGGKELPAGRSSRLDNDNDNDDDWRPHAHEADRAATPSELDNLSNPATSIADSQETASQCAVAAPSARGGRQPGKPKVGGSSRFRGVTRHSTTGRYESHLWDANAVRPKQSKGGRTRGKQLYMGGYEDEEQAARTWDMAAIKWGLHPLNFPREDYAEQEELIAQLTREELIAHLKRGSSGFSRGKSRFRGVTRHQKGNLSQFEARIGMVPGGPRYQYLGVYRTEEEAAKAYDAACRKQRGARAVVNFPATSQEDRAAYAADHGTSSSFGAVESPARAPPYAAAAAVEQELCPQLSFGFDMDHPVTPPASPVLMPITPFQGNLISSPTATYGSSDSCFVPPHAAGLPPTPSYGVTAQQQQQPLLSMPLPPLESPPLQPELDFSLAKLFDSPADCSLLNEHEAWGQGQLQLAPGELHWADHVGLMELMDRDTLL